MRSVRKGNVSIPLAIVDAYVLAAKNPNSPQSAEAITNMHKAILQAKRTIDNGLKQSNLSVCIGKMLYLDPRDAQRFLSGEIPRITAYAVKKDNHNMPLYYKHKPEFYQRNKAQRKPRSQRAKTKK